jgi:hypothetical protein
MNIFIHLDNGFRYSEFIENKIYLKSLYCIIYSFDRIYVSFKVHFLFKNRYNSEISYQEDSPIYEINSIYYR